MPDYIDGFAFPIKNKHVNAYKAIAKEVAEIWREHGALSYNEYLGDKSNMEGTLSFRDVLGTEAESVVIFGWVAFVDKAARDLANKRVAEDLRMAEIVAPLLESDNLIFDVSKMAYGGFQSLIQNESF